MMVLIGGGRRSLTLWVLGFRIGLMLLRADAAPASDPETLRAVTVKITVKHSEGFSSGAGIVLCQRADRLHILTAKHVVTGVGLVDDSSKPIGEHFNASSFEIEFHRNNPFPVRVSPENIVVQRAESKDLALLTLSGIDTPLMVARLGSSSVLSTGDRIESVGHLLDTDWDWIDGKVRTVGEFIRHSADAAQGYSGGPLFNASGEVVGVNLQTLAGVARAMPIDEARLTVRPWIDQECLQARPAGERESRRIANTEFAWRYVPRGNFRMGRSQGEKHRDDDEARHMVRLTLDFLIGETEVTQGQWRAIIGNNPSKFKTVVLNAQWSK